MYKYILTITTLLVMSFSLMQARAVQAGAGEILPGMYPVSAASAVLLADKPDVSATLVDSDLRVQKLTQYLSRHNAPLAPYARHLIQEADRYSLPWHLVAAIAGVESTFCKRIPYQSYNCWGWRNGDHVFQSYEEAISIVSETLHRSYFSKGRTTPETIMPKYAPPSKTWAGNVRFFMNKIEQQELPSYISLQMEI